ncbi:hypothetical protein [Mumia sp. ZJ430]|uniref:hypothetical protein n=1 Tax=Mumia sp. ZJ430 TaxID=2708083 RepID=UPI0014232A40|nr:hypothetical protein [Mumia sp. ZJ430]
MTRRLAVAASIALVALATPLVPAAADGADGASQTTAREVTGATLRWGLSNEVNNRAFAPGSFNFMSAGTISDPGKGGQTIISADSWSNGKPAGWKASSGNVALEKKTTSGSYAPATWSGLTTSPSGAPIASPTSGTFTDHQIVLSEGSGWVDPDTGRASLSWRGSFTVVFYSGMSFFSVSDPALSVDRDGTGVLTATLSGFGSSLADPSVWKPVAAKKVTLATLPEVQLGADGTTATPSYEGVRNGAVDQNVTKPGWGSWPTSFVAWLAGAGSGSYWYSSGGAVDANKPPLPVHVAWELGDVLDTDPQDPGVPEDPDPQVPTPTTPTPENPAPSPAPSGDDKATKTFKVSDAQLRWGLNSEMSNSAFAPGTYNFFSAGTVPNPGRGGQTLPQGSWKARAGNVRIEKETANGGHHLATWDGLRTTPNGQPLGATTNGLLSDHTVVIDGGTGTVNPTKKTAMIRWKGTFTVLLYSGMSYFTITDPVLTVSKGVARLDGTLGGYASDRNDTSVWKPLSPTSARLADASVRSLSNARGFTVTPRFTGVRYEAPGGAVAQNRDASGWGAFPTSFVRFQEKVGTASYWYSSGASTDRFKSALPITFSYDADKPASAPKGGIPTGGEDDAGSGTSTGSTGSGLGTPAAPFGSAALPPAATDARTVVGATVPVGTTEGIRPVAQPLGGSSPTWPWWAGGAMALGALLVTAGSRALTRRTS